MKENKQHVAVLMFRGPSRKFLLETLQACFEHLGSKKCEHLAKRDKGTQFIAFIDGALIK